MPEAIEKLCAAIKNVYVGAAGSGNFLPVGTLLGQLFTLLLAGLFGKFAYLLQGFFAVLAAFQGYDA